MAASIAGSSHNTDTPENYNATRSSLPDIAKIMHIRRVRSTQRPTQAQRAPKLCSLCRPYCNCAASHTAVVLAINGQLQHNMLNHITCSIPRNHLARQRNRRLKNLSPVCTSISPGRARVPHMREVLSPTSTLPIDTLRRIATQASGKRNTRYLTDEKLSKSCASYACATPKAGTAAMCAS
jgi:hypothetical protein